MKAVSVLIVAACASAAHAAAIDVVGVYAGTWKTHITQLDTPYSAAQTEDTTVRNECWRSGEFQLCHQYVDDKSAAMLVFNCSPSGTTCATYPITPDAEAASRGTLIAHGDTWTFPWHEAHAGKTMYFRVVNVVVSAGAIDYRREYSDDQVHWHVMATGHETRQR